MSVPTTYDFPCLSCTHFWVKLSFVGPGHLPKFWDTKPKATTKVTNEPLIKWNWNNLFQANIDNLNIQIDQFESEIESLQARRRKLDRDVSVLFDSFHLVFNFSF